MYSWSHSTRRCIFSSVSVSPRQPGDARLHFVTQHVAFDHLAVLLVVSGGVWPRTDQRHAAADDVDELRQLVETGPAEHGAEARDARIALLCLSDAVAVFADGH